MTCNLTWFGNNNMSERADMLGVLVDWFESVPDMPWLDVPYCILMAVFLREHKGLKHTF